MLTPLEHKQIHIQATQDLLFEQRTEQSRLQTRRSNQRDTDSEGDAAPKPPALPQSSSRSKRRALQATAKKNTDVRGPGLEPKIEGLSYKRLVPGSMVLGQISQVNRYDLAVMLPNNLTGFAPITALSEGVTRELERLTRDDLSTSSSNDNDSVGIDLRAYFKIGQYIRAYVTSVDNGSSSGEHTKRHIELSLMPHHANHGLNTRNMVLNTMIQAEVVSVEDHGLLMSLGLEQGDVKGFLPYTATASEKATNMVPGTVLLCLITSFRANGKLAELSTDPQCLGGFKDAFITADFTIDSLLPGTAVDMVISDTTSLGVRGKVLGLFDVTADLIHSGFATSEGSLGSRLPTGTRAKARIICTFPAANERKLGVSFLDHILNLTLKTSIHSSIACEPTEVMPISSILDEARVAKVEPEVGLFLDLGVNDLRGFAHISRISDHNINMLSTTTGPYQVDTTHKCRVTGYNSVDGLFLVSLEQKILDLPFLRLEDVRIGQTVSCIVHKFLFDSNEISGLLLNITDNILGIVPKIHLADIDLKHPERKFKEGSKITARVLSVDPWNRRIRLSLKKSLVNSGLQPWTSYDTLSPGMQSPGIVTSIVPKGAMIQFYGPVRAFLPVSQMSESYIENPETHFRIGQVVTVTILSVDGIEHRMLVSCRDQSLFGPVQEQALRDLCPGRLVSGLVSEKLKDEIVVELNDHGLKAILSFDHLGDNPPQKVLSAAKSIRVGQNLQDLMVLYRSESKRLIKLTRKPSLVSGFKDNKVPGTFQGAKSSTEVIGYIKNITASGIFVQFVNELTGFLPKSQLRTDIAQLPDFGMIRNQSIVSNVLRVDCDLGRLTLTQKSSSAESPGDSSTSLPSEVPKGHLSNPVDGISTTLGDFGVGKLTKARILAVKETQLNVQLADGVQGRIDASEVFERWEDIKDRKHPLNSFAAKQILPVRVLGTHDSRNHRFLPITNRGKSTVYELSARCASSNIFQTDTLTLEKVEKGSSWICFVNNVTSEFLWVNLSPNVRGRIRALDVSDNVALISDLQRHFPMGSAIKAHVLDVDVPRGRLDLSARSLSSLSPVDITDISTGAMLTGRVTKIEPSRVLVQLSESVCAPLYLTDISDDYAQASLTSYRKNQMIRVCATYIDLSNKKIQLSARPSRTLNSSLPITDPEINEFTQIKTDDVVRGFIKNISESGIFISLSANITAFARVSDLSDQFLKDWKAQFKLNQLVKGKVIALDPSLQRVQLSLKNSALDLKYKPPTTFADLKVGQVISGKIRKVADFGLFVVVDGSANVSGLCHKTQISDEKVDDIHSMYEEGDNVRAKILKMDSETRRISFGMKTSSLGLDETFSREHLAVILTKADDTNTTMRNDTHHQSFDLHPEPSISSQADALGLTETSFPEGLTAGGFDWSGRAGLQVTEDIDSGSERSSIPERTKRRRNSIKADRTLTLDIDGPQTAVDFERILMSEPNSTGTWVNYMAFYLHLNEVAKARGIAERAIDHRSRATENEVLDRWVAYLNLEVTYGDSDSIENIFKRACECNDDEVIHSRLVSTYIQLKKHDVSTIGNFNPPVTYSTSNTISASSSPTICLPLWSRNTLETPKSG